MIVRGEHARLAERTRRRGRIRTQQRDLPLQLADTGVGFEVAATLDKERVGLLELVLGHEHLRRGDDILRIGPIQIHRPLVPVHRLVGLAEALVHDAEVVLRLDIGGIEALRGQERPARLLECAAFAEHAAAKNVRRGDLRIRGDHTVNSLERLVQVAREELLLGHRQLNPASELDRSLLSGVRCLLGIPPACAPGGDAQSGRGDQRENQSGASLNRVHSCFLAVRNVSDRSVFALPRAVRAPGMLR